jgi:hypothetical protein
MQLGEQPIWQGYKIQLAMQDKQLNKLVEVSEWSK